MTLYQGVDIVDVQRLREVYLRHKGFGEDIFTENERGYCFSKRNPYLHLAGMFAAKEACLKALGIGMSGMEIDNAFREVEVVNGKSGKPVIGLKGWVKSLCRSIDPSQITVSISHTGEYAVSTVMILAER